MESAGTGAIIDNQDQDPQRLRQFEAFYRDQYSNLISLARALTGRWGAAEDLVQDAFVEAHRSWPSVATMTNPEAWMRRVVVNLATSRFRRLRIEAAARLRLGPAPSVEPDIGASEHGAFWREVRRLPRSQARVLALKYLEDMTVREIATTLGVAEGTVKALLHQGRSRLSRQLAAKGWIDSET